MNVLKIIMNNKLQLKKLSASMRARTSNSSEKPGLGGPLVKSEPLYSPPLTGTTSTSAYFSPRRTRSRAQVKNDNEKPEASVKTPSSEDKLALQPRLALLGKRTNNTPTTSSAKVANKRQSIQIKSEPDTEEDSKSAKKWASKRQTIQIKSEPDTEEDSKSAKKWEPANWQQTLANIQLMREKYKAPVDTMGCHMCFDPQADEKTKRFHILVALMLSSQTKDEVTYDAMERLKANGLTPNKIMVTSPSDLEQMLYPVSFYKTKTKYLQKTAMILYQDYDSDIPNTFSGLIKLPGVGPKMGHICMSAAWNIVSGIGVDTHVHRITNRLRWTEKSTADPERTRVALEEWLPSDLWSDINPLLVGFGQTLCTPTYPKCGKCANASICPSRGVKR